MSDGKIDIEIDVESSKAESKAKNVGTNIGKSVGSGVDSGLKSVNKSADNAAKGIEKPLKSAATNAKSSFSDVGSAAKTSFSDVGDAAKTAAGDAASAFESIPADAQGAFADVGSEAQSGFDGIADAAQSASGDASSAFESIPADAAGAFSDVSSQAQAGFSGIADAANSASGDAASAFSQIGDAAQTSAREANEAFSVGMVAAGNVVADAAETAVSKIVEIGKSAIETGMDFDKGMSQVAATMGVATDQVGELTEFAKHMGETTAFSASQAAEALNYMALAGYDAETSMRVLPTVLNLAAAGNMELAAASDMVTDAQSALGLSVEQAEVMVDQMAKTSSKTNTSVEQLGNAFLTVGGTAKNLKGGTAELSQMLGILADNGIKGSEGGTALRNVILSLSAPTDTAAEKIEELGLKVFDAEGNMRSMPDIIQDLNSAMDGLTQQEKTEALNTIFNKVDLKSVNALLGTSAQRFDEVAVAIEGAQGSAEQMANTQLDNLAGDVTLLESATEGFFISISDKAAPALRQFTQFGTNTVMPMLTNLVKNFDKVAPAIASVASGIAGFVGIKKVMSAFNSETGIAAKAAQNLGRDFSTMTTRAKVAAVATNGLKVAVSALKSVGIVAAISLGVEAFMALADTMGKSKERADQFKKATDDIGKGLSTYKSSFDDAFGSTGRSLAEAGQAAEGYGSSLGNVNAKIQEAMQHQGELADKLNDTWGNAGANNAMVQQYADTIRELAGNTAGSAEKQARLQLAVDGLNSIMGTSYSIVDSQNGVLSENVDMILASAQAWQERALAEAASAAYSDLMQQKIENAAALAAADEKVRDAQEKVNGAANDFEGAMYAQQLRDAKAEAEDLQRADDALNEEMARTEQVVQQLGSVYGSSTESLSSFVEANEGISSALQSVGADSGAFIETLSSIGVSVDDLSSIIETQGQAGIDGLVAAYQGGSDSLMAWVTENIPRIAESYTGAMDENAAVMQESTQAAMDAQTEAISTASETTNQAAADNANSTADAYIETLDGRTGDVAAAADGLVTSGMGDAEGAAGSAGQGIGEAGASGIASGFGTAGGQISQTVQLTMNSAAQSAQGNAAAFQQAGAQAGTEYANGVNSGAGAAGDAGTQIASSANDGMSQGVNEAMQVGNNTSEAYIGEISKADARPAAAQLKDGAIAELNKGQQEANQAGQYLGQGFINGMGSTLSNVIAKARELARAAIEAIKQEGQQGSPWKTTIESGEFAGQGLGVGIMNMRDYIVNAFKSVTRDGINAMGSESRYDDGIVWERSGRFGGKMIAKGIIVGFETENPLAQMQQSIASGMNAITLATAASNSEVYNNDNRQTLNFNQPISSPDEVARQMRLQQHYGLAGRN